MNNIKKREITQEEYDNLEKKLEHLILVKRKEVIERLKIARSYGDLSENSEYDSAKDEQRLVEREIQDLEALLRSVEIISVEAYSEDVVSIGKTITVFMGDIQKEETYHLVGNETSIFENKISLESPFGRAVNNHIVGDVVEVNSPNGIYPVEILIVKRTTVKET